MENKLEVDANYNKRLDDFFSEVNQLGDKVLEYTLIGYFIFGIFLSFFYDTWLMGFGVGASSLVLYFITKATFKGKSVHHYMGSFLLAIFMAQFIYQMHGLFEMHFTALIGVIALVSYRNWKLYIPITLTIVVHHSIFAYMQYLSFINNDDALKGIYFTQLDYMDLSTFLFHAGLVAVAVVIAAIHTMSLEKETKGKAKNIYQLELEQVKTEQNIEFADQIAQGNFDIEHNTAADDRLGQSLLNMRKNLIEGAEREKMDKFINVGIAKVSDLVRDNIKDVEELTNQVVSFLVKYMEVNQGAVFLLEENGDDHYLELKGAYAYGRRKFIQKKINLGEGMVGQCFLEKETIYLTNVPEQYAHISSGLGDARPRAVILVPIKTEDEIVGIMEFAAFGAFEEYKKAFLEKVGENLASAVTNLKTNQVMKKLYEESMEQSEALRSQEEEMRQNMEELQATQEEMLRKNMEIEERNESHLKNEQTAQEKLLKQKLHIEELEAELSELKKAKETSQANT